MGGRLLIERVLISTSFPGLFPGLGAGPSQGKDPGNEVVLIYFPQNAYRLSAYVCLDK